MYLYACMHVMEIPKFHFKKQDNSDLNKNTTGKQMSIVCRFKNVGNKYVIYL